MKVKELVEKLQSLNQESDVFIKLDDKLVALEDAFNGQFFRSVNLLARFEYDVVRAEQTLLSCLAYQRDQLTGSVKERIERALGANRVAMIIEEFDKDKKVTEEDKKVIEEIQEDLNKQDAFVEEVKPVKVKKESTKKPSSSKKSSPKKDDGKLVVTMENAEGILGSYYSGGAANIPVEAVREAKKLLGEEKSREIFNKVRNG